MKPGDRVRVRPVTVGGRYGGRSMCGKQGTVRGVHGRYVTVSIDDLPGGPFKGVWSFPIGAVEVIDTPPTALTPHGRAA